MEVKQWDRRLAATSRELIDQTNIAVLFLVCSMWDGGSVRLKETCQGISASVRPSHLSPVCPFLYSHRLLSFMPSSFSLIDQKLNMQIASRKDQQH